MNVNRVLIFKSTEAKNKILQINPGILQQSLLRK